MPTYTDRREGGDLLIRLGETRRIEHVVAAHDPLEGGNTHSFTAASASFTLYDTAGVTVAVTGTTAIDTTNAAAEHLVAYNLQAPTTMTAAVYAYVLKCAAGDQTLGLRGFLTVLPASSKLDRWCYRIKDYLLRDESIDDALYLTESQLRKAAQAAADAYSRAQPYERMTAQALTSGTWEYNLSSLTGYTDNFSTITRIEYPVDDTQQIRDWLEHGEWEIDEELGKWRFLADTPGASETARVYYTSPHVLSDTEDTVPAHHYEACVQYGAGLALMQLANRAPSTNNASNAEGSVNYRTKEQEYNGRAKAMMEAAERAWGGRRALLVGSEPF